MRIVLSTNVFIYSVYKYYEAKGRNIGRRMKERKKDNISYTQLNTEL